MVETNSRVTVDLATLRREIETQRAELDEVARRGPGMSRARPIASGGAGRRARSTSPISTPHLVITVR